METHPVCLARERRADETRKGPAMQPMMWNFSTIVISLAIIALAVLAVRRMAKRGLCDCHDGECSSGECAGCGAVDKMVADMERAARAQR